HTEKVEFTKEIIDRVPKDVELIYWDYYKTSKDEYNQKFREIRSLSDNYSFAGGIWKWVGFAPHNHFSLRAMEEAFQSAEENEVDKILMTAWGDNGGESSHYSILPSLIYLKEKKNFNKVMKSRINKIKIGKAHV